MLKKEAIYLYGNHDPEESINSTARCFSVEQGDFKNINFRDKTIHIEHGHVSSHYGVLKRLNKRLICSLHIDRFIRQPFESAFFHLVVHFRLQKFLRRINNNLKYSFSLKEDSINIVGHTHIAEYDKQNNFINSGFINFGFAWYVEIDKGINLKFQKY